VTIEIYIFDNLVDFGISLFVESCGKHGIGLLFQISIQPSLLLLSQPKI
jgi:hypothetical protein